MMRLILIFLFSACMLYAQEDPNLMWTYKASFHSYPSVHPNGNILIRSDYDVLEINGLTGELVRKIYVPTPGQSGDMIEISQDGSRFIVRGCLVDFESGEVLRTDLQKLQISFLHPSNDKVVFNYLNKSLRVINLNDNSIADNNVLSQERSVTAMKVSNDGKFIAFAQRDFEDDYHTHFYLYDAQTMKLIRELEDVPAEGRTIEFIQFSENAKYVGYGNNGGSPKATLFTCETPYKKWEFNDVITPFSGKSYVGFINESHLFLSSYGINSSVGAIYDIDNEKEIFKSELYSSRTPQFNKIHNSIITDYYYLSSANQIIRQLFSLDFNKILNSVSINEPNDPIQKFITEYRKGILKISGIESILPIINLTINDIKGNLVYQNRINHIRDIIEIPVQLQNGVYLLHIQDMNKSHTAKFLVVE